MQLDLSTYTAREATRRQLRMTPEVARTHAERKAKLMRWLDVFTPKGTLLLARYMSLPQGSVKSLLDELVDEGRVVYDHCRGYRSTEIITTKSSCLLGGGTDQGGSSPSNDLSGRLHGAGGAPAFDSEVTEAN